MRLLTTYSIEFEDGLCYELAHNYYYVTSPCRGEDLIVIRNLPEPLNIGKLIQLILGFASQGPGNYGPLYYKQTERHKKELASLILSGEISVDMLHI